MATAQAEALDFEPEDDDLMDEGVGDLSPRTDAASLPKLKSAITGGSAPRKTKGRGFREEADADRDARLSSRDFNSLDADGGPGALRSIKGWIILVTGLHEESQEDDLQNAYGEFGEIENLHLNLDRRTGFVKIRRLGMPLSRSFFGWSATQGLLFVAAGSISFVAFVYAAVVTKLLPRSDNAFISAVQNDRYYCFLVPLTLPILVVAVYFHWLCMKLFKHA